MRNLDDVIARYRDGESLRSLAGLLGIPVTTLRETLIERGVEIDSARTRRTPAAVECAVLKARTSGTSIRDAAVAAGVSFETVRRIIARNAAR